MHVEAQALKKGLNVLIVSNCLSLCTNCNKEYQDLLPVEINDDQQIDKIYVQNL